MKTKNNQEVIKQKLSSREKKHQASLKNNSTLHFQIGLIVVLFMVFGLFQIEFERKTFDNTPIVMNPDDYNLIVTQNWVVEPPKEESVKVDDIVTRRPTSTFMEVPDDVTLKDILPIVKSVSDDSNNLKVSDINIVDVPVDIPPISLNLVQVLPIFPGCERYDNKKEQMKCFMTKVSKHINKKFDSEIAAENDISGKQRIFVMFTINAKGEIVDIKARSPYDVLEKEAINAVKSLPKMTPAKQGYKKVSVSYTLPINFEIE